jgi:hypothetical protein
MIGFCPRLGLPSTCDYRSKSSTRPVDAALQVGVPRARLNRTDGKQVEALIAGATPSQVRRGAGKADRCAAESPPWGAGKETVDRTRRSTPWASTWMASSPSGHEASWAGRTSSASVRRRTAGCSAAAVAASRGGTGR